MPPRDDLIMDRFAGKSAIELKAEEIAKAACDRLSAETGGRIRPWDEQGLSAQAYESNRVLMHIAIWHAMQKVPL